MTPSDKIRAAIAHDRELSNAATPEPWIAKHEGEFMACKALAFSMLVQPPEKRECLEDWIANEMDAKDADFCEHARTALPRHADALEVAVRAIQEQSHAPKCHLNTPYPFGDTARAAWDAKGCDCWKQDALAAIAAKLEGKP